MGVDSIERKRVLVSIRAAASAHSKLAYFVRNALRT
jgi:hypothetical protein